MVWISFMTIPSPPLPLPPPTSHHTRRPPSTPHTPPPTHTGVLTVRMFVLILEGKWKMNKAGEMIMPTVEAIESAPADLKERLSAIESVDLNSWTNLKGRRAALGCLGCVRVHAYIKVWTPTWCPP